MTGKPSPYGKNYGKESRSRYPLKQWLQRKLSTWKSPRALRRLLDCLPRDATVVDVGCGDGALLNALAGERPDLKLYGVDIYPVEGGAYERIVNSADAIGLPDASVDLCICKHLVEHLDDPFPVIKEMARILKPDGRLYLECPDARSASFLTGAGFWDDPTHRRPFTQRALERLATLCSLRPISTGRVRDYRVVFLGPFYLPLALWKGDRFFAGGWGRHLFGLWIYLVSCKPGAPNPTDCERRVE